MQDLGQISLMMNCLFTATNLTNQKYWFIDYLCLNSVRDTDSCVNGLSKRDYLKEYQRVRK